MSYDIVKVQMACCSECGAPWKVAATEETFSKKTIKEFAKMMKQGFIIKDSTLEEARLRTLYCSCSIANKALTSATQQKLNRITNLWPQKNI